MHFVLQSTKSPALAPLFSVLLLLRQLALISELIVELALNAWCWPDHLLGLNERVPSGLQGFWFCAVYPSVQSVRLLPRTGRTPSWRPLHGTDAVVAVRPDLCPGRTAGPYRCLSLCFIFKSHEY